jgi:ATP synthase protein I
VATNRLVRPHRTAALKLVGSQALFVVMIGLIIYLGWDFDKARSAVIGGTVAVLPNLVFALYAFRFAGAQVAKMVTTSFYRGQSLKLLTTFVLFIIAFRFLNVVIEPMMITFIITLMTHWFAPFYFNQR